MRDEYDLKTLKGRRPNPYAKRLDTAGRAAILKRYYESEQLVRLDDDVAAEFEDAASVNEALRLVVKLRTVGKRGTKKTRRADAE